MSRVLVVARDAQLRAELERVLGRMECAVIEAADGDDARAKLADGDFDLVISDLHARVGATSFVPIARELRPALPIVIVADPASARDCARALRDGATDFVGRSCHPAELRRVAQRALRWLPDRSPALIADAEATSLATFVGDSPQLRTLLAQVEDAARGDQAVLLIGEPHTGKAAIARLLHALSTRCAGAWATFSCAGVENNALRHALFGDASTPGKLTAADGGTLLLCDLDRLDPADLQRLSAELASQHRGGDDRTPASVRVLVDLDRSSESPAPLRDAAEAMQRALGALTIEVPAIRERSEDVPVLIEHFVAAANRRLGRQVPATSLLFALKAYSWPGNLEELQTRSARYVEGASSEADEGKGALVVPIERLAATLVLQDGSRQQVQLPLGKGRPLEELFHSKELFLPVAQAGQTRIYARSALACVSVRAVDKPEADAASRTTRAVRVQLLSGVVLEGQLSYVLVTGRGRVTDVLNEPTPSFAVYEDDLVHHIVKAHVLCVQER